MSNTEAQASAGEDLSPAQELKAAVAGFMSEITSKLQQQDERMTRLDRKSMIAGARPALSQGAAPEAPHQKAFAAYLRTGDDDALRGLEIEGKAMSTSVAADGGYLVDPQIASEIQSVLNATASIRAIANVVNVDSTSYDVLIDHSEMGSGWATETAGVTETGTPVIDRISIPLHELSALPKVSQRLLDDTAFEIESWLAGRIADKFARSEAAAFVSGDGVDKPRGFLDYPRVDDGGLGVGQSGHGADRRRR